MNKIKSISKKSKKIIKENNLKDSLKDINKDISLDKASYHITKIKKGINGQSSKILEEIEELMDAEKQNCKIMALVELSDLVGAIDLYLQTNYPSISMEDLQKMSNITQRVFRNGHRK